MGWGWENIVEYMDWYGKYGRNGNNYRRKSGKKNECSKFE